MKNEIISLLAASAVGVFMTGCDMYDPMYTTTPYTTTTTTAPVYTTEPVYTTPTTYVAPVTGPSYISTTVIDDVPPPPPPYYYDRPYGGRNWHHNRHPPMGGRPIGGRPIGGRPAGGHPSANVRPAAGGRPQPTTRPQPTVRPQPATRPQPTVRPTAPAVRPSTKHAVALPSGGTTYPRPVNSRPAPAQQVTKPPRGGTTRGSGGQYPKPRRK